MKWADRLAQVRIRRLYRSVVLGIYDEEALQEVGSALHARCVNIAAVADAFSRGSALSEMRREGSTSDRSILPPGGARGPEQLVPVFCLRHPFALE